MNQLHIHERGAHVVMFNATTASLYDEYASSTPSSRSSSAEGREDLVRQGFAPDDVGTASSWTCATATSWCTTAVVFDINRMNGVGDVLHMIRTFSDIYGQRFGEGCQAPEAGIRVQTIRVASYVDGDVVRFESLEYDGERTDAHPGRPPRGALRRDHARRSTLRSTTTDALAPQHAIARPGDRHDREHHLPGRTRHGAWSPRPRVPCGS